LEIEEKSTPQSGAGKILRMRDDSNFLLTTILWGNVGINVLLTLLSESVMAGVASFLFSTFLITLFGEIIPQAYFSRNALRMAKVLSPVLRFYQVILYPVAKPSALMLDRWLGKELTQFLSEVNIKQLLRIHVDESETEIESIEGIGAINFLSLDDLPIESEGEPINPESIIPVRTENGKVIFPDFGTHNQDPFIQNINLSGEKWIIFTNETGEPMLALDADGFLRSTIFSDKIKPILEFCHEPVVVRDKSQGLDAVISNFRHGNESHSIAPIKEDLALLWTDDLKQVITGADILGRLLQGI